MLPRSLIDFQQSRPHARIWRVPGRINLIGEHTDYHEGWVLPAASNRDMWLLAEASVFPEWRLYAARYGEAVTLPTEDPLIRLDHWSRYAAAVLHTVAAHNLPVCGMDIAFDGDIPIGGGMSSSSALTCGLLCVLNEAMSWDVPPLQLARLARESEHRTGVLGGIMDQYTMLHAKAGQALLLDCRTLVSEAVAVPAEVGEWYIFDSGVSHDLVHSAYNDRRAACGRVVEAAVRAGVEATHLRDLEVDTLAGLQTEVQSGDYAKACFVLEENRRVHRMAAALSAGDDVRAGQLLIESHAGLRDDYRVSCPELDLIVDRLCEMPGLAGARMMGAGFGGTVLALLQSDGEEADFSHIAKIYGATYDRELTWWKVRFGQAVARVG